MSLPPPGTFRLYPFAKPPIPIGEYVISGDMTLPGGTFETMNAAFDVIGPRYTLPPDQVLSTYPPASARGPFSERMAQIVIRRRTLPWEWATRDVPGTTTPEPWLALVLIAEGEGNIIPDVLVADAVTKGTVLQHPEIADTAKTSCLEVPQSVVDLVFPTRAELPFLVHVREVDLADTELALGDDDGWLAVVLCNRLPQPGVKYTACLINIEGQQGQLPTNPAVEPDFDRFVTVFDTAQFYDTLTAQPNHSQDAAGMGLIGNSAVFAAPVAPAATALAASRSATSAITAGGVASVGAGGAWAKAAVADSAITATNTASDTRYFTEAAASATIVFPFFLIEQTYRFPVLVSWSFTCNDGDDFQKLANQVTSRLLGYVEQGPENPDGGPRTQPLSSTQVEAPSSRPLPLVTETGHVVTAYHSRIGEDLQAYFRGPLTPDPSARTEPDATGRVPLAHHADQLRYVIPDGLQDLSYSAAFEIGRLLALSRPGVVAALNRWRRERYAAAATAAVVDAIVTRMPQELATYLLAKDPIVDASRVVHTGPMPGPDPQSHDLVVSATGRRFVRGLLSALGDDSADLTNFVPAASPGFALNKPALLTKSRDSRLATGLGLPADIDLGAPIGSLVGTLWQAPVTVAERSHEADLADARAELENLAGELMEAALTLDHSRSPVVRGMTERGPQ